jgi:hypothetical protein
MDSKAPPQITKHPLRFIWASMKQRCTNKNVACFKNYGGSGISFDPKWACFRSFIEQVESEIGPRPSKQHSLDRIDNTKGYEPKNIRWSTQTQQLRNQRRNRILEFDGQKKCLTEWAESTGINKYALTARLRTLKWDLEKALTTPVRKTYRSKTLFKE